MNRSTIRTLATLAALGDVAFKQVVDRTLIQYYKSGAIQATYDKWFSKPIPPKGVTLNFPVSAALRKAYANPTDSPDPASYQ
jgi:glutamate/aspartate transport system substrate-binding protein